MLDKVIKKDCIEGLKDQKDESVDLIIADPPYFKVIGKKWDYKWSTIEDYCKWSESYFTELYRVLRKGGTFYLFGYFRSLIHLIPILEKIGFELRQQIIIDKGIKSVSGRATKDYKMFPNTTESIIFLVKDSKPYIKKLLKERQKSLKLSSKDINEQLGVKSNGGGMWSIYTGNNMCKQLPTREQWNKLCEILNITDIPYFSFSQTYNAQLGCTDVWNDIDFYKESRIHPTQKPIDLINRLILTSSNKGDIILDPFMGSGATAISALINDRHFIGFEIDDEYYNSCIERIDNYKNTGIDNLCKKNKK